ncbi:hypothetical protein [Marinomonas transparens]|uniref:Chromosome partition protein Smc n=1 Tax=Marinomonas transparens TaxID=2795388 RepID=A0A934N6L5_9GAMM|nr:hypothetical protein [Marinomonas transparens]MBJ7538166.1 hypothetical protein [Marinomonas transparens]
MKARTAILIPIALGLMVSACSTTSEQRTQAQEATPAPPASNDTPAQNEPVNFNASRFDASNDETSSALRNDIKTKQAQIDSLEQQLIDNKVKLASLNQELDAKDQLIASLQTTSSNSAENLAELEKQKTLRKDLESRYAALKLDNDLLKRRISQLENENTSLKQQITSLEKMPTSEDDGFKQSYLSLLDENTSLQQKYANLETDNEKNQKRLTSLKKENLILGGALSDARAQHQVLWDRIRALNETADKNASASEQGVDVPQANAADPVIIAPAPSVPSEESMYAQENTRLRVSLADLEAQIAGQRAMIKEYQNEALRLEAALDEGAAYEARWKDLDSKLVLAEKNNTALTAQLNAAESELARSQAEFQALSTRLNGVLDELKVKENDSISMAAEMEALQSQISSQLRNVQWQLPNEMALNNTFEILVTANVRPALTGQTYIAELVTDSAIQMISDREVSARVQNGRLQWRWRVSGLNERPEAQLNLSVTQQMNFQEQKIMRQVYRSNETLSLVNNNLFDKYGYWTGAILLGLLGGFLVGRLNKQKNIEIV